MLNQDYVQTLLLQHLVLLVMVHQYKQFDQLDDRFEIFHQVLLSMVFQLVLISDIFYFEFFLLLLFVLHLFHDDVLLQHVRVLNPYKRIL
jgi:hypothetical protein